MSGYGSSLRRVPALGGALLTDVDIMKVLLVGKAERGFSNTIMKEIYSMNDFYLKCGGFNQSYYAAYVARSFFEELLQEVSCEMKVLSFVASDAVQASYEIKDGATPAVKIFDVKAGRKNQADLSAFGNKIGIKIKHVSEITTKLAGNIVETDTTAVFTDISNLAIGNYIKFVEGANEEVKVITNINLTTKTVSFSAITESSGFSSAGTTVYRLDWNLQIAVQDSKGQFQKKEEWEGPFAKSNSIGVPLEVNDSIAGSDFLILNINSANASDPDEQLPAELSTWTSLSGGSDGTGATDNDWKTIVEDLAGSEVYTFLLAPESSSVDHNEAMLDFCTDNFRGMYYAQSSNGATEAILKNLCGELRGPVKFGMLPTDKWVKADDPTTVGGFIDIPMVGIAAAHWFNTYARFGESKVAAGNKKEMVLRTNYSLLDSNGLVHDDLAGVGSRLIRSFSANICKHTRGKGITINSARTFSTDDGYKFQNQIMQFILYGRSILTYLREIEQDRSGRSAQEAHRNTVWAYMYGKFRAGHLYQGQKEDGSLTEFKDCCIIVNDFTVNTIARINEGIEEVFLQFVAPPPIEEPILSLASAGVTTVKA